MILSLRNPNASHDELPGFGDQHLATLRKEAEQAQQAQQMVLAVAHGSRHRDDSMLDFIQHSTIFVTCPHDADVVLQVGDKAIFKGRLAAGNIYWTFIQWDHSQGDLVLVNGSTYRVPRQRILQRTLMNCILFHPKMDIEAKPAA